MRHLKPLLLVAAATALLVGGCRSGGGVFNDRGGNGSGDSVSSTLVAAQAEIANNTGETTTPIDATAIRDREDNPETSQPVAVTF